MLKRIILGLVSLTLYECIIWSSACGMPNNSTTHSQERITHYVKAFKNLYLCLYLCFLASESVWPYKFQAHVNQAIVTILYMHRLPMPVITQQRSNRLDRTTPCLRVNATTTTIVTIKLCHVLQVTIWFCSNSVHFCIYCSFVHCHGKNYTKLTAVLLI